MDMTITTKSAEEKLFDDAKKVAEQPISQGNSVEAKVVDGEKPESLTETKEDIKSPEVPEAKIDPEQTETKDKDDVPKKNHNGRRFDDLTRDLGFYKKKAETLEAQMRGKRFTQDEVNPVPPIDTVPDREKFESESDYNLAVLKWHVRNELEQERLESVRKQSLSDFDRKVRDVKQGYDDYDQVLSEAMSHPLWQVPYPHVTEKVLRSNYGPDLMYYLASNLDEADKVSQMDPVSAISYLTEVEGLIKNALTGKEDNGQVISKVVSRAPAPYQTPAGSAAVTVKKKSIYDKDLSRSEFQDLWKKEIGQK